MELNREFIRKARGLIVFTALIVVCLWKSEMVVTVLSKGLGIVFPFILGGAIAFILNVPMSFIERKIYQHVKIKEKTLEKLARPCSLILAILFIIGIVLVVVFIVAPQLATTVASVGVSVQEFIPVLAEFAGDVFRDNPEIETWITNLEYDWNSIVSIGLGFIQSGAGSIFDTTVSVAMTLVSALTTLFVAIVFAIYVALQKETLGLQLRKVLFAFVKKGRAEAVLEVCVLTYKTFSSFLTGQCLEAVILGCIFIVVLVLFKMPFALLIGVLIGFTALIPIFGAFLGCAVGAILIFIDEPMKALTFIIIFLVVQQLEGNLIYPHVVGNSVGLPAIWVLAAVSIGGSLMGVVGMLVFIPITSVVYALFREVVHLKLKKNNIKINDIKR